MGVESEHALTFQTFLILFLIFVSLFVLKSAFDTGCVVSCDNIQCQKFSQVFHKSVARYDFSALCKKLKVARYNFFWQKCVRVV